MNFYTVLCVILQTFPITPKQMHQWKFLYIDDIAMENSNTVIQYIVLYFTDFYIVKCIVLASLWYENTD